MENFNFSEINRFFEVEEKPKVDYKAILNDEQYEAVITTEGPLLIIAGAGTGKTNTLTKRVMYLIDKKNVLPQQILMLTFTNKAAGEMIQRAKNSLDERCGKIKGCTYHGFCSEFLRKYAIYANINSNFTIIDSTDAADALNLLKEKNNYSKEKDFPKGKELVAIYSAALNKNKTIEFIVKNFYTKYEDYLKEIIILKDKFVEYKEEKDLFDYDDLIVYTNKILREHPEIAKKISDTYQYIMVDEYQDSNLIQLELLTLLRQFDNKNICVVGDDFQSIYSFRGSNFKNIINFPKQFEPCKVIILNKNYRSNQEILDLSNAVTLRAKEKYDKQLVGLKSAGHKPYLVKLRSSQEEAMFVLYTIIKKHHDEGIPYSDMAVLIRGSNNSSVLEGLIAQQSGKNYIPYKKFGGIKFMEKAFVKDIFAFLRIIINPLDELAWFRVFQLYPNIGPVYAKKLTEGIFTNGIDELINPKHLKNKYGQALPGIHKFLNDVKKMEFNEQIDYIINNYYYSVVKASVQNMKTTESAKRGHMNELDQNIEEAQVLIKLAEGYKTASAYVTALSLEVPEEEDDSDFLTISTIHSAKGLEFKIVFVLSCVEGSFPWDKKPSSGTDEAIKQYVEEMEEERRVFYVAITRAKDELYLTFPSVMFKYGKVETTELSRFLKEDDIYKKYCKVISQN